MHADRQAGTQFSKQMPALPRIQQHRTTRNPHTLTSGEPAVPDRLRRRPRQPSQHHTVATFAAPPATFRRQLAYSNTLRQIYNALSWRVSRDVSSTWWQQHQLQRDRD
jgi:hypothetical protein